MPTRRKEVVSVFRIIPLHGKDSQNGQSLGARIGLSKAKQKWCHWQTKEAFGRESESLGRSRRMGLIH